MGKNGFNEVYNNEISLAVSLLKSMKLKKKKKKHYL